MSESLKQRTAKGLFWGALNSGSTQVLNLVVGIVLARMLSQSDYGVVGVLTVFTAIAGDLQSSGFTQGLINLRQPAVRDYNSVFSFNVLVSVLMYTVLFLCAPLIAAFYHQPCLTSVSRVLFITFLIASLGIAHGGYMSKNMMNREMAIIGALSLVCSGTVGIVLAVIFRDYWALVWQQITYISVLNLGRYYYVKAWRPRLTMDFGPVRQMAPFAMKILVTKIINTTSNNILTVIFGRLFSIHDVGNYSQAFKWDTMANSLVGNTVGQIAQAVMIEGAVEESDDGGRQLRIYRKMVRFTCFLAMPLMFGLALVGNEFIGITLGERWISCVPLLQVLCISGAFMPLYTMYQNLAISQGRSDVYMWLNIFQIVFQVAVILLFYRYGMQVMVAAYSAFIIVWLLPWHFFAGRLISYGWLDMLKDVVPFLLASAAVMVTVSIVTASVSNIYLLIILRFGMAAVLYYAVMKLFRVEILRECERFVLRQ